MLSIITCSIKPEQLKAFKKNIETTIGIPFELIAFDNRVLQYGLCKVYNECARQAKYDFLCFAHEDISFQTYDWGKIIISELSKPDCGVIGFAGASHKSLPSRDGIHLLNMTVSTLFNKPLKKQALGHIISIRQKTIFQKSLF